MIKAAAIALLLLVGADQFLNRGQVLQAVLAMLKQIARAYGI